MGFNKKHIEKNQVLQNLKNQHTNSFIRDFKIDLLFKADALILDSWTGRFYSDLRPEERPIRKKLKDKYRFSSSFEFASDEDLKDLKSLSEALVSFYDNDSTDCWCDIYVTLRALNIKPPSEISGNFIELRNYCLEKIISHFDGELSIESLEK
jgi:hypothetical protein